MPDLDPLLSLLRRLKIRATPCISTDRAQVTCTGTYWDGGSRSQYYLVPDLAHPSLEPIPCPSAPAQFGGGAAPTVDVPEGGAAVVLHSFRGKVRLHIYTR